MLTLTGVVALWMVFAIVLLQGIAQSLDNPARLSFVSEMTGPADLPNAIGLNSALFQVARIVGPAFAGLTIVAVGTGWCFALNALSFVAVIGALMAMDVSVLHRQPPVARAKGQVREGLRYIRETPELRSILTMTLVVGTLAINFPVVLPLIAKVTFDGNAATYSWMTVSMGIGALFGALAVAHKSNPTARVVVVSGLAFGVATIIASFAPTIADLRVPGGVRGCRPDHVSRHVSVDRATRSASRRSAVVSWPSTRSRSSAPRRSVRRSWVGSARRSGPRYGFAIGGIATLAITLVFARTLLARTAPRVPGRTGVSKPGQSWFDDASCVARHVSRVCGSSWMPPALSSSMAGTGSGSPNRASSVKSVGRPVPSTTHHDASSAMPFGSVK